MRETARFNKAMHFSRGESTSAQFLGYSVFCQPSLRFNLPSFTWLRAADKSHDDLGDKKTFKCPPKVLDFPPFFPDLGKQRLRNGKKLRERKQQEPPPPSFFWFISHDSHIFEPQLKVAPPTSPHTHTVEEKKRNKGGEERSHGGFFVSLLPPSYAIVRAGGEEAGEGNRKKTLIGNPPKKVFLDLKNTPTWEWNRKNPKNFLCLGKHHTCMKTMHTHTCFPLKSVRDTWASSLGPPFKIYVPPPPPPFQTINTFFSFSAHCGKVRHVRSRLKKNPKERAQKGGNYFISRASFPPQQQQHLGQQKGECHVIVKLPF